MRNRLIACYCLMALAAPTSVAQESTWPVVAIADRQPVLAQLQRVQEALQVLGTPLNDTILTELQALRAEQSPEVVAHRIQSLLDPMCLLAIQVPESGPPSALRGKVVPQIMEQGWTTFLIKVVNPYGRTERLMMESPNSLPLPNAPAEKVASRWMQFSAFEGQPMKPNLSGLAFEYRLVQIYSRDQGPKQGIIEFCLGGNDGEGGSIIKQWRFDEGLDGWKSLRQAEIEAKDGSLIVDGTGEDPHIGAEVEADAGPMVLRFWARASNDGMGQVFWWTQERKQPDGGHLQNFLLQPGRDALYEVPFVNDGNLAGIRLDPSGQPSTMRIDWIDLVSSRKTADWAKIELNFEARPAASLTFHVLDAKGNKGMARFEIRDEAGNIYPSQSKRLAPDFFFQRQIYRGDGESIALPPGKYTIRCLRGPESVPEVQQIEIGNEPASLTYQVKRWIDPLDYGYWSGDHHIHAAGCLHYENPTQGVHPPDMLRHIMGEDVKVGCCLTWGPCFDYQKRFFTGKVAEQSQYPYLLRYDVEVSGFGSHQSGHLNLLNLTEQIYPGGESKDHWPTLGLNTLRWAKAQGAVCGPAHSSLGLTRFVGRVPGTEGFDGPGGLPNYNIPAYDGIGANEFVVDVTHLVPGPDGVAIPAVDFISAMNTERTAEWNMWYHVLNCGFPVSVSGETDFPCITGESVGLGRVYVHLDGPLNYDSWVKSLANGDSYVSDGTCHLMELSGVILVNDATIVSNSVGSEETMSLSEASKVRISIRAAARREGISEFPVELVVNGYGVETKFIPADGETHVVSFEREIVESSWVAVRSFPNAHTNPIYMKVADKPIRPSKASIEWCLMGVEQCWQSKQNTYAADEQQAARDAYEHARSTYAGMLSEFSP